MSGAIDVIGGVTYLQMSELTNQLALEMEAASNAAGKGECNSILASDLSSISAPVLPLSVPSSLSPILSSLLPSNTKDLKIPISGMPNAEKIIAHTKSESVAQPLPKVSKSEVSSAEASKVAKAVVPVTAVSMAVTESAAIPIVAVVQHEDTNLSPAKKVHGNDSSTENPTISESEINDTLADVTDGNKGYEKKGRGEGRGRGRAGRVAYTARSPIVSEPAEVEGQSSSTAQSSTDVSTGYAGRGGIGPSAGRYEGRGEGRGGFEGRGRTSDGRGRGSYEGRGEGRGGYEGRGRTSDGRGRGSYEGRGEGRGGYEGRGDSRGRVLIASDQKEGVNVTDTAVGASIPLADNSAHATSGGPKVSPSPTTDNHSDQVVIKSRGLPSKKSDVLIPSPVANQSTGPTGGSKPVYPPNATGGHRPNVASENAPSSQVQNRPAGNSSAPKQLTHNPSTPSNSTYSSSSTYRGRGEGRGSYPNMTSRGGRAGSGSGPGSSNSGRGDSGSGTGRGAPSRTLNPLGNPQAPYGGVPAPKIGVHLLSASSGPAANNSSGMS